MHLFVSISVSFFSLILFCVVLYVVLSFLIVVQKNLLLLQVFYNRDSAVLNTKSIVIVGVVIDPKEQSIYKYTSALVSNFKHVSAVNVTLDGFLSEQSELA